MQNMALAIQHSPLTCEEIFLKDVLAGLSSQPKYLPSKYFYDEQGSLFFEKVCQTPEYYAARAEQAILGASIVEIATLAGDIRTVVELGSGNCEKSRALLHAFPRVQTFIPIDISPDFLKTGAQKLQWHFPRIKIVPLITDFTDEIHLPLSQAGRTLVFFPGSTIGNFVPAQAEEFLAKITSLVAPHGGLLIGVDLKKSPKVLERAYNDRSGWTAAFNKNLLVRLQREFGAQLDVRKFEHRAFYNALQSRVEMHLVSLEDQFILMAQQQFHFSKGETIRTEYSYKYTTQEFASLAAPCGLKAKKVWTDAEHLFSVQYLTL